MQFFCKSAMLLLAVLNLVAAFLPKDLSVILFIATISVLLSGFVLMVKGFKRVTLLFLFLGCGVLFYSGQPFSVWVGATNSMTNVIAILVIMQIFSVPIEAGSYSMVVHYWLTKSVRTQGGLYLCTTLITHIFASFLLFGTIPTMISLLGQPLMRSVTDCQRFISTAISRGYALAVLWAPGAVNLLLVVQATGVRWIELVIPGLIVSLIGLVTSYIVELKLNSSMKLNPRDCDHNDSKLNERLARGKACHIIAVVLGLVLATMIFEYLNVGTATTRVMLAGAIVALTWTAFFWQQPGFKTALANYWQTGLLKAVDLAPLFVAMGIFSAAIQHAGVLTLIQPYLQSIASSLGIWSIILLPIILILCAVAGIHPFISIVMFGQVLTALELPVSPIAVALCLALGGSVSYIISPFAGIVLTLAKFINCRTTDIALRWNWVFCLLFFVEGIVFAYLWGGLLR